MRCRKVVEISDERNPTKKKNFRNCLLANMHPIKEEQAIEKNTVPNGCFEIEIRNESHIYKLGMELL